MHCTLVTVKYKCHFTVSFANKLQGQCTNPQLCNMFSVTDADKSCVKFSYQLQQQITNVPTVHVNIVFMHYSEIQQMQEFNM